jgi:murein DD-endopeptidase MepM/ murein hydrolase activator NlpD
MRNSSGQGFRGPMIVALAGLGMFMSSLMGPTAEASVMEDINSHLYVENSSPLRLFIPKKLPPGIKVLVPVLDIPQNSILSVDVITFSRAIERQRLAPEKANAQYLESENSDKLKVSTAGWVCGVRVVDIADEDLRNDPLNDRGDLCASLEHFTPVIGTNGTTSVNMEPLKGNGEAVKQAYATYLGRGKSDNRIADVVTEGSGDTTLLTALADALERQAAREEEEAERGIFFGASTPGKQLISPLRGCAQGCLHITSEFGMRRHPVMRRVFRLHKGVDFRAATGTPVVSVAEGRILAIREERDPSTKQLKGYGLYTIVVHPAAKMETLYAHLSKQMTSSGQSVSQGQTIALSGSSGLGTGPHLHFETRVLSGRSPTLKDPRMFLAWLFNGKANLLDLMPQSKPANYVELAPEQQRPDHTHCHS